MGSCQSTEAVSKPPDNDTHSAPVSSISYPSNTPQQTHEKTNGASKSVETASTAASTNATNGAPKPTRVVALNDSSSNGAPSPRAANGGAGGRINMDAVLPPGAPTTPLGSRSRFASYASGASTPNTSSGNVSWDGENEELVEVGAPPTLNLDDDDSKHGGGSGASVSSIGSSGSRGGAKNGKNAKTLKHSGSAIGLDDIRTETAGLSSKVVHIEVPFGKPIEEIYDGVHDGPVLGSGVSGLVRLVTHKATGVKYAVKCLDLGLVGTKEGLEQLREEIFIMCQLDHPNIVRLEEVYESHSEIYLVQELCLGGELFDRLDEQPDYHYTESECARLVKQMLSAVRYLHSKGIIHRDLKLENFLFSSTSKDSELKMIDFGLSKHFQFGEVHHEAVGTPYTVAPEVIHGTYDERCDIWAIGVITFLLVSGDPPFGGCGGPEPLMTVRANILKGEFFFEPEDVWSLVSNRAKEFITALLVTDPKKRPTARDAQKHAWLREWASRQRKHSDNVLNPNVVKALVNFKEFSDMRKLLCEVLSFTLLPDQIKELRREFEKMDTDGSGEISLAALKQVLLTNAGAGSLGALTEEEVEDIFNAMRVNKSETRIHWHEFIAAGLSQCQVDDRNLRLAFDRLDSDHKGYITLDDIMDLMGTDEVHSEEVMREMWKESMDAVNCTQARITYDHFLLLMKGQGGTELAECAPPLHRKLVIVPEDKAADLTDGDFVISTIGSNSLLSPIMSGPSEDIIDEDLPLSMDDDADLRSSPIVAGSFTPPQTPTRSVRDYCSPGHQRSFINLPVNDTGPVMPSFSSYFPGNRTNVRSQSVGNEDEAKSNGELDVTEPQPQVIMADVRRAVLFPEHLADGSNLNALVRDKSKSALQVNRQLYRAHRQMRLAVMEASKRFEEQQANRARELIIAQIEAESKDDSRNAAPAGLVMRRGRNTKVSAAAVKAFLDRDKSEQQALVEKANKRGGRGRRTRKKTISDMSGMMASISQDEFSSSDQPTAEPIAEPTSFLLDGLDAKGALSLSSCTTKQDISAVAKAELEIRGATVPGEFRKVQDPFSRIGKYGGNKLLV